METLIRWWVRNPVAANLLMLIIVTGGWLGLRGIEKEAFPSVQQFPVLPEELAAARICDEGRMDFEQVPDQQHRHFDRQP